MAFTFAYLVILLLLIGLVIRKQINKIKSEKTFEEIIKVYLSDDFKK